MYRRVYRQEGGGLSDLGSEAFMRQYIDNYIQDYNRRNQGEIAQRVGARPVPRFNNRYLPTPRQPIPIPQQVLDVPQQVQQQLNENQNVATPISMQNEQQATGGYGPSPDLFNRPMLPEGFVPSPEGSGVQPPALFGPETRQPISDQALVTQTNQFGTPISMQNQQQGLPSLMKIVNEQRNPTPSNTTGFKTKAEAMADHNEKYIYSKGGLMAVYQNANGSWSYQPPYDLDNPPPRPLGLLNPGIRL